ncbi:uncharacterized protein [Nicotiana tomentosiformis]|uniref:uncharacterized protein n=1 Tax=Nicotiana tomentosiformis TaxID=4098 RepID=UPI00388C6729
MELEGKMRKRLSDCQNTDGSEGGHLEKAYLLLDMRDLGNLIDGVKRAKHGEGPSGTKSKGPLPPPPLPSDPKGKSKGKGKMDDLTGIKKDNATIAENVETSDGRRTPAQNELVLRLEQNILELQGELEQVRNLKDLFIKNIAEELKKLTGKVQSVKGGKGFEGLNYENLCIQPDVELPEGHKPPKIKMFDRTGDLKVHLRTYCDKLVEVGKDERIGMKLFMRSLTGDALSWYISQNPNKWVNWVSMASDFMDRFRFNRESESDIFYIKNLKKKPTETFCEYATRWRS